MPKISVIIPIYNAEEYLAECLDSMVNQTFEDIEIICVNDGSTDSSPSILNKYLSIDRRIKIINQENKGAGAARNRGMQEATGEFLYFIDADDYADLRILEKLYNKITKTHSDISICKNFNWNIKESKKAPSFRKYFSPIKLIKRYCNNKIYNLNNSYGNLFQLCNIPPFTKLYRHEFIKQNGIKFQEIKTCNDVFFNFYSISCANAIAIMNEWLVVHRTGHNSLTKNRAESIECILLAFNELEKSLKDKGIFDILRKTFSKRAQKCFKYELEQITDDRNFNYWKSKFNEFIAKVNDDFVLQ